jgi:hypothetical protein
MIGAPSCSLSCCYATVTVRMATLARPQLSVTVKVIVYEPATA